MQRRRRSESIVPLQPDPDTRRELDLNDEEWERQFWADDDEDGEPGGLTVFEPDYWGLQA